MNIDGNRMKYASRQPRAVKLFSLNFLSFCCITTQVTLSKRHEFLYFIAYLGAVILGLTL